MPYPVRYSTRSYLEYVAILDYVSVNFGYAVTEKVDAYFEEIITQISINPRLFPYSDKKESLRRCVISPQTTLFYRFNGECVELASFRGNKMNPDNLSL